MTPRGTTFSTIRSEGGLLTPELLARLAAGKDLPGLDAESYGLARNERLNEVISSAWTRAESYWAAWQAAQDRPGGAGVSQMRNQWLLPLFAELGYGDLVFRAAAEEVDGRRFVISHRAGEDANAAPVHTVAPRPLAADDERRSALDIAGQTEAGPQRRSPYTLLQEYLNRTPHLWGIVSDGRTLRLLRDNASLSRAAYIEIDLETMFRERVYADFVLLYRLLHRSRLPQPGQEGPACWLEVWRKEGEAAGARALDDLRGGVETAIHALGQGLLDHPANEALRERLQSGDLSVTAYYRQLLRLVYRFLFLLAAEERDLLFPAGASEPQRDIYRKYYGVGRLRELALRRPADRHDDLWQGVQILFRALRDPETAATLGLAPLGSLFNTTETPDIDGRGEVTPVRLSNGALLAALRGLGWVESPGAPLRRINFRDMDVEELGSVYEGLLEQQPLMHTAGDHPSFTLRASGERKSSGSYYTNPGLVQELIRSALDPAIAAARAQGGTREEQAARLLALTVCDPACGSGHFLLAAARRIGRAVAEVQAEPDEPSPASERAAIRAAIGSCVYGVDLNPLAVDLCKVALWLEGQDAGKPLQFLGGHIRHGNALIGATAAVMAEGVPDGAFKPVAGDDNDYGKQVRARNRSERKHKPQIPLEAAGWRVTDGSDSESLALSYERANVADNLREVQAQTLAFQVRQHSIDFQRRKIAADIWTAAFFWPLKPGDANPPTDAVWRRLAADPKLTDLIDSRTREALRGEEDSTTVLEAQRLARRYKFFHWELEFEEVFAGEFPGFDVVVGNPPWDSLSPDVKEYFSVIDAQVRSLDPADQRRRIEELLLDATVEEGWKRHCYSLYAQVRFYKQSGRYSMFAPGNLGKGDFNIYRIFVELALRTAAKRGRVVQLVPEGLYNGANAMAIRSHLFEQTQLECLVGFENHKNYWFSSADSRLKFCFYSCLLQGHTDRFEVAWHIRDVDELETALSTALVTLPVTLVREFSPDALAIMELADQQEFNIAEKMYGVWPKFGDESAAPPLREYMRELDMGNDRHLFTEDPVNVPVYEGRMVDQFDHRAKGYRSGRGRAAVWEDLSWSLQSKSIQPQWFVERDSIPDKATERTRSYRVGFCDVTSPTNQRTLIAALLPPGVISGHKVPTIRYEPGFEWAYMVLLGVANSLVVDFVARKKVGLSMTYTVLDSLPIPRLRPEDFRARAICRMASELSCTSAEMVPFWNLLASDGWVETHSPSGKAPGVVAAEDRALLRARLDAFVASLVYGLTRDEFQFVLESFPQLARDETSKFGEYRTARLCLEAYDYFAWDAIERLRTAVTKAEIALSELVVQRLGNDLARVPEAVQAGQEAERLKQGKAPRAATLSDFLGAGYLSLLPKVIKPNREAHFADLFESNRQVDDHFGAMIGLRNALAHSKEQFLPDAVRTNGERELRWFAAQLGWPLDIMAPPQI